jgi:hypothetical protein
MIFDIDTTEMNAVTVIFGAIVGLFIVAAVMSLPVMLLWDWLMPGIFGLREITWFEAWGLLFLSWLLFKSHTTVKKD